MKSSKFIPQFEFAALFVLIVGLVVGRPSDGHAARLAAWGNPSSFHTTNLSSFANVEAISGGGGFTLILNSDGTVSVIGTPDGRNANVFNIPDEVTNITAISAGSSHALALTANGSILAWGSNLSGQTNVPTNLSNVVAVAAGPSHSLALRTDGTVAAWGWNFANQATVPPGLKNVKAIAAGGSSVALLNDGRVVVWGQNAFGEADVPAGLANVIAVASGGYFNLALKVDGTIAAWGDNSEGQTEVPTDATNVIAIAAGFAHGLALRADGTVIGWGRNIFGQTNVPGGLSNVISVDAGGNQSLALTHNDRALILIQPLDAGVPYQSNGTFSVIATGAEPLAYRWYRNGIPLSNNVRYNGSASSSLVISNAQFSDIGNYFVVVSNALGSVQSSNVTLTVISPPIITAHTSNQTVRAGSPVLLSVTADGTPSLSYQWAVNGTNLPDKTDRYIYFIDAQPEHTGHYSVTVSNLYGTATAEMMLTVTNSAPYFTQTPSIMTTNLRTTLTSPIPPGTSVVLKSPASGSLPLSHQWRLNGVEIPGATNALHRIDPLTYEHSGYYSLTVSNAFGVTNSAKILINVSQLLPIGTPLISNANMPLGLSNVTAVSAGGSHLMALIPDGTVRIWLVNSNFILDSSAFSVTNVPGSVTNVVAMAAGRDHCLALRSNGTVVAWGGNSANQTNVPSNLSNVVSVTAGWFRSYAAKSDGTVTGWGSQSTVPTGVSNVVSLSMGPSQVLAQRRDGTVLSWANGALLPVPPGLSNVIALSSDSSQNRALRQDGSVVVWTNAISFTVAREGNNPFSNVVAIADGNGGSLTLKANGTVAATGFPAGFTTNNIRAIAAGGVQTRFGVAILGNGSPAITLQPFTQIIPRGSAFQLHSRAAGVQPMQYQWWQNNLPLPGATNASLLFSNVQGNHSGIYRLLASNALGYAFSATAKVATPFSTNLPTALNATNLVWSTGTSNTAWFAQNQETHDSDTAAQSGAISHNQHSQLSANVSGPGTVSFWWKASSEAGYDFLKFSLDSATVPLASISGETDWEQRTFSIPAGSHVLRWIYAKDGTVSSGRDAGWVDEVVFVPAPTLLRHPFDQTAPFGVNVTIPAIAGGPAPLSFQWLKDGGLLPGATNQYLTLTNVNRRDSALYALRVSNAGGSVTSSNAALKVLVPQRIQPLQRFADGSVWLFSRDADGGGLIQDDLAAFEIQSSTNLQDWITLPMTPGVTNGSLLFRDTNGIQDPMRFYRIVEH